MTVMHSLPRRRYSAGQYFSQYEWIQKQEGVPRLPTGYWPLCPEARGVGPGAYLDAALLERACGDIATVPSDSEWVFKPEASQRLTRHEMPGIGVNQHRIPEGFQRRASLPIG